MIEGSLMLVMLVVVFAILWQLRILNKAPKKELLSIFRFKDHYVSPQKKKK